MQAGSKTGNRWIAKYMGGWWKEHRKEEISVHLSARGQSARHKEVQHNTDPISSKKNVYVLTHILPILLYSPHLLAFCRKLKTETNHKHAEYLQASWMPTTVRLANDRIQ